ncbi:serine/threonine receptor-like kinase NFP [Punica granatum]|uniref:Uncharacterized protein n=2 Tax=Punica granatum TaxID=22663 RepID=A0A218W2I9_PUNGR|nr:serine/threonine receptor-like kinase NFP [Punica granatum]OWM66332.1 hypothetical protein CDL15_Pgr013549 [Punica granatum]PKI41602.1 hypothetical protein CRG98_038002 [Punica granatum]
MAATTLLFLFLFLLSSVIGITSQSLLDSGANFSCSNEPPCETYLAYFAQLPNFASFGNISDLFGVSRLDIMRSSNLASKEDTLAPGQLLLVPVTCGCNGTPYFSNVTYDIKKDDNYYLVSVGAFENLTNWHVVEDMNPKLNPNFLAVGTKVVFPLFCKCPSKSLRVTGINYLITYVWQPGDTVLSVANKFNATPDDILSENGNYRNNFTLAVYQPVLIPVSEFPMLSQLYDPPLKKHTSSRARSTLTIAISSGIAVCILLGVSLSLYIYRLRPRRGKSLERKGSSLETSDLIQMKDFSKFENFSLKIVQDKLLPGISGYLGKPTVYEKKAIMEATMNLGEHCRLGKSVYRAFIDGQLLAVKRIKDEIGEELKILQRVNHANLVKLVGVSLPEEGNDFFFLVYEYAENGPLDKWLYRKCTSSSSSGSPVLLTWSQRLRIALDVAIGLQYLHEHTQPSIVHGDIRTGNILLDSRFKAKISNFTLARPTVGPLALKVDVYAFGVLLLELLSGKKTMGTEENGQFWMQWRDTDMILEAEEGKEERLRNWMDQNMEGLYPIEGVLSLVSLARACTSEKALLRPTMTEIVFNLSVLIYSSSSEVLERSWASSGMEAEEVVQIIKPITAR